MTKLEKYGNKVAEAAALEGRSEGVGSGSDSQLLPFIFKKEDNMKSARINFGIPESEYILEVDDSGAATSLVNQDTGTVVVTIINNLNEDVNSDELEPVLMDGVFAAAPIWVGANSSMTWTMVTYQGEADILYAPIYNISIEGDAEANEDILVIVSGDCTLIFN